MGNHTEVGDEFTVYDYAAKYGLTRKGSEEWLENRVRIGIMKKTKKKVYKSGGSYWTNFYSLVESEHGTHTGVRGRRAGKRV
jgi:hypothetical protein